MSATDSHETSPQCFDPRCGGAPARQGDDHYPTCPLYVHMTTCYAHLIRYPSSSGQCPTCAGYIAAGL